MAEKIDYEELKKRVKELEEAESERKKAEQAARRAEAWHRTLIDTIPDLVWLKDLNGIYLSCNPPFESFFGAKESEITGKTDYDFIDKTMAGFFREHDRKAIETGGPNINEEWLTFAENGYHGLFETIKTPMHDSDGNLIGVLGISRDITGRKKAEDALKKNEQRYKSAQRMGQVGNWEYDIGTEKFWGSDEVKRIYGFDPQRTDFTVDEIESCIPERVRVHQTLVDLIEKNRPYDIEFEIRPVSGPRKKMIKSIAEVIKDELGSPIKVIGVVHDITQQKKSEEARIHLERQLRQSQKMESIGSLAGGIAHDFNNILSAVIGYAELSLDEAEDGTLLRQNLFQILSAGNRAKALVKQILTFARQSQEETKPLQVSTIANEALKLLRSSFPTNIELRKNIASDSLIQGTPTQVHQIFMNLCTNAAQAMENTGGIIEVGVSDVILGERSTESCADLDPGPYLRITVADSGPGIPPDIIDSVFEPYFTTKAMGDGTGMGLATVHGIVKSHQGEITVANRSGNGALFTVYLPLTNENIEVPNHLQALPGGTESILVVDDELPIVNIADKILKTLGYAVTARTSSIEALELFKSKPDQFDLVVTDMSMPNMTGVSLAVELMKIRSDIPIILCTGYSKAISENSALKMGIKAFAHKPLVKVELAGIIRKVLDEAKNPTQ